MTIARPHRVLHVTECYAGGVSRAIEGIVRESPDIEHHLLFTGDEAPEGERGYATVRHMPGGFLKRIGALRSLVTTLSPDTVHLHSSWAGVYGRVLRLPVRVMYQPHCYAFEDPTWGQFRRKCFWLAERLLGVRTDVVVAVSERERALGSKLAPRAAVTVVPNRSLLDINSAAKLNYGTTGRRVVMIGRIAQQKDPEWFAEVARRAADSIEMRWIGDGDDGLKKILLDAGVAVTGWLDHDGVVDELDRADFYLHSALYEGFPLSVLDAAARRLPLIIRDSPAFQGIGIKTVSGPEEAITWLRTPNESAIENLRIVRETFSPNRRAQAVDRLYSIAESANALR